MMKKIFLLVTFFVLGKMWSYAQYPITQNIGSDSTIVVSKGALQSRLINVTYPDTATANLQRIRQYPGAQIATTSGGINLWVRNTTATAWLPINTGSGNNIYTIDGTLTGNRTLTGNNYSLTFTGLSQFLLTVGNQTFTVRSDSASLTRKLSYASNRGSTFTLYSLVDKNYVDSAIASSPAGTVTQINTNNNTGITGGPITSTGTLAIDTLLISTRAWRQKGVDSLQANINLKLNIVDTTGMLANYVNSVGYGLGKTSQTVYVDSASLSNYYLRRKDSLTATNPLGYVTQKILADTAAAIRSSDLGGTVTSVATNNGTGITGGTITTSGTLAIDTTVISTRAWRQKGVDSLQANINLKLNISDTASMLNPYLRKVDTASLSNRINQKLNISDTASMLSPYLRSNTAAATYVPQTRTLTINGTTQDLSANRTYNVGTVTSVGLTMPAAFNVANSPVTGSGTLAVTGAGLASQYIRGDGTLANFPGGGGGGGASVSYYLNGSVNQGTFGGNTYYQMNKTPILGAGTDFTTNTNGYIAQFITNAGDPALLNIPAGNWNFELFFSASSGGGTPSYYVELYKYDGTTFTLIASGSTNPDVIVNSAVDAYFSALPVPQTTLTLTDRLAVRIYVTPAGRTITLHTEDNNLCQVVTTFTTGITAINSLTAQVQYLTTGTSGTDFNISSLTDTHTFNLPVASGTNTGKLSNTDWTTFNNKVGGSLVNGYITKATGTNTIDTSQLFQSNGLIGIGTTSPTQKLQVSGNAYVNGQLFAGDTALSVYQVEGILNTPYVLGRKAVNNTLSTEARPTGVMGHVVGRGSIANRLQAANFYTTTDSASTANSTGSLRSVNAWTAHNGSGSLTTAWGSYNIVQNKTTGTITNAYGSVSGVENRGATSTINKLHGTTTEIWNNYGGTIDTAFGQVISIYNNNAASNIGAVYGLSIGKGLISASGGTHYWRNSGTIGTSYGLYLDSSIDVGTTKYALFSNSNSNSYFRAKLGIGTTSPDSAFQVATGAYFQRGIRASGLPQAAGTKALRIDASGTISYADTLIDAGGTVTSVATNNGTGITGGTITTSGTLAIDTLLISTRAWRQKGVDSLQANINLKLNISDTASMLSPYLRKADTTAMLNPYFRLAGVGLKNTGQTVYADTLLLSTRAWRQKGIDSVAALANTKISGSLISGYIPKATGTLTVDTSQIYQNNGNIGIGTISPASGFKVDMTGSLRVGNGSSYNNITINGNSGAGSYLRFQKNGTNKGDIGPYSAALGGTPPYSGSNDDLTYSSVGGHFFNTNAGVKMYLNNAGNLGLSASPDSMLTVLEGAYFQRGVRMSGLPSAPGTRALRINANGTLSVADTLVDAGGTVTSVATNNGTGITGGTITTTGTLAIDTLLISTRAWRQKGIDSVAALINSNVSGTTNYVAKFTGTNTIGNSQLFDNGTNVGIGTTSPTERLQVNGAIRATGAVTNNTTGAILSYEGSSGSLLGAWGADASTYGFLRFYLANSTGTLGSEYMRLNTTGLGIGTTSPAYKLDVVNAGTNTIRVQNTSSTSDAYLLAQNTLGSTFFGINATGGYIYNGGALPILFYTSGNERMRLDASGNLGIGTTSPTVKLQVENNSHNYIDVKSTVANVQTAISAWNTSSGSRATLSWEDGTRGAYADLYSSTYLTFTTQSSEKARITSGGNLLVGTTTDAGYKLDVNGSGRFNGVLTVVNPSNPAAGTIEFGTSVYKGILDYSASTGLWNFNNQSAGPSTTNYFQFQADGTPIITMRQNGNVGIGTTSPSQALDVFGIVNIGRNQNSNVTNLNINSGSTPVSAFQISTDQPNLVAYLNSRNSYALGFYTNDAEQMRITSSGNVGIGTATPLVKLHVINTAGVAAYFTSSNNSVPVSLFNNGSALATIGFKGTTTSSEFNVRVGADANDFVAYTSNTERMRITSAGNVGIGTTSPSRTFQVNGYISAFDGTTNTEIVSSGGVGYFGTSTNHPLAFQANNTERMRIATTGAIRFNAYGSGSFTGTRAYDLSVDASGNIIEVPIGAGTITGSGTANYIPKFTSSSAIGNSTIQTDATGNLMVGSSDAGNAGTINVSVGVAGTTAGGLQLWASNSQTHYIQFGDGTTGGQPYAGFLGYAHSADALVFGTNTSERMRLTSGGSLGIGTSSPVSTLDVNGNISVTNGNYISLASNNPTFTRIIRSGGLLLENNTFQAILADNGNFGIGTSAPSEKLDVYNNSASNVSIKVGNTSGALQLLQGNGAAYLYTATNQPLIFSNNNSEKMRLDASGNLGLGTSSPAVKLDIAQSSSGSTVELLRLQNTGVGANTSARLNFYAASTNYGSITGGYGSSSPELIFDINSANGIFRWRNNTTEQMRLDASGNLGLGVTPSAWGSSFRGFDIQNQAHISSGVSGMFVDMNAYRAGAGGTWTYKENGQASLYVQVSGEHLWYQAASGIAGNPIAFTQAMTLDASGNLAIGSTTALGKLQISTSSGTTIFRSVVALGGTANADNLAIKQDFISGVAANYLWSNSNYMLGVGRNGGTMPTTEADAIALSSFVVNSSGRVGIGTTSPNNRLSIFSGTGSSSFISSAANNNVEGTSDVVIGQNSDDGGYFWNRKSSFLSLGTANTERMRITSGGQVGIGTSSPQAFSGITGLSINGNTGALFLMNNGTHVFSLYNDNSNTLLASVSNTGLVLGTNNTERMRITSGGNVLVGTTTDAGIKLDVAGSIRAGGILYSRQANYPQIVFQETTSSTDALIFYDNVAATKNMGFRVNSGSNVMTLTSSNVGIGTTSPNNRLSIFSGTGSSSFISSAANNNVEGTSDVVIGQNSDDGGYFWNRKSSFLSLGTANTERMRITSAGQVLIGASSAISTNAFGTGQFQIHSTSYVAAQFFGTPNSTDGSYIGFWKSRGSSIVQNGDELGGILFGGYDGTTYRNGAAVYSKVDGTPGVGDMPSSLIFYTTPDGAASFIERMRITSGGNVGIGTTSPAGKLEIVGSSGGLSLKLPSGEWYGASTTNRMAFDNPNQLFHTGGSGGAYKFRNAADGADVMTITNTGNVGIGTSSPNHLLELNGGSSSKGIQVLSSDNPYIQIQATNNPTVFKLYANDVGAYVSQQSNYPLIFNTNSTERMRITSGGIVSVGATDGLTTSTYAGKLAVFTAGGANLSIGGGSNTTNTVMSRFVTVNTNNANSGNESSTQFYGITSIESALTTATSNASGNSGGYIMFKTKGDAGTLDERMRITSGGNVGIGTSAPEQLLDLFTSGADPATYLQIRASRTGYGSVRFNLLTYAGGSTSVDRFSIQNNSGTNVLNVLGNGNVGIGTSTPSRTLSVGGTNAYMDFKASSFRTYTIGSDANGFIVFDDNASAYRMVVNSSGNVGIGTTSPAARLSVNLDNFPSDGGIIARFTGGTTTPTTERFVEIFQSYTGGAFDSPMLVFRSNTNASNNSSYGIVRGTADGALVFSNVNNTSAGVSAATERMRIASTGNVLVGSTTDGGFKLYVNGTTKSQSTLYLGGNTDMIDPSSNSGFMTIGSNQPIRFTNASTTEYMRITTSGIVGIGTSSPDASVKLQVESSSSSSVRIVSSAASGGDLYITSVNGGSESRIDKQGTAGPLTFYNNGSERMRLTSGGELLINTTTDAGAYPLQVNGSVYATAYYESSDLRLKNVLSERQGSDGINTITFKWKDGRDSLTHIGYAAQQVEKVLPDAVKTNTDGYKTINYDEVQSLKIANLEQEIAELKKIIKQLIDKK